ncbi:hypothetical protein [Hymenobacter norwichensis]|uniref:hypothetical protein n=1 Tax=Hymenobacter norwichensis TaxID=223903 RepID=UPI0012F80B7C|nr:hypothetical protein [Hymenobacter norwichensis]
MGRHWDPTNCTIDNVQGGVIGLVHSVVNVTEWMQAEAELRASEVCKRTQTQELEAATHHFA